MSKSSKIAKSALIIMMFTIGSKFLGFFRETLIAKSFGSGMQTDTFLVAITATSLISGLIGEAINITFIPILSEIELKEGKRGKIEHTNNIINIIFVLSIVLVILEWVSAPLVIRLLARGFEGEQFNLAVKLTRIGLPTVLFGAIIGTLSGYLQSENRFIPTAALGIPNNLIYIFFLIFLSHKFGIKGLMVATVFATISQLLILIPQSRSIGYRYKFKFDIKDKYIKKVVLLSLPVFIGVAISDLNAIIDRTLASNLVPGSISALNYANRLQEVIQSIFISAIITVIFPLLSKESSSNNVAGVKRIVGYGINIILIITVPATVGLVILSAPIVEIAFKRGAFDNTAAFMTSQALIFYSIGLVATSVKLLITRVYYSLQDTKTPVINGAITVVFNIVLNIILVRYMAHLGLALATSISSIIGMFLLLYGLKRKIGPLGITHSINVFIKTSLASMIMGVVTYLTYQGIYKLLGVSKLYNLISLIASVGIGAVLYVILCYLFKVDEIRDIITKVMERVR